MVQQRLEPHAPAHTPAQACRAGETDGKEMVRVPAGEFLYGDNRQKVSLPEFWIDRAPVTNGEFARFVQATGYKTTAEQVGVGCACIGGKWEDTPGADWRHPGGPSTDIQDKADHRESDPRGRGARSAPASC